LYHAGFTIHLQERLGQFTSLSYNELASVAIDQERLMKAIAEANEKKRKRCSPLEILDASGDDLRDLIRNPNSFLSKLSKELTDKNE
jgi:hypothetical protein